MSSDNIRKSLYEYFSANSFTKQLLPLGGILAIIFASMELLSEIITPIDWFYFYGTTGILLIIAYIFAFANSDFKKLFIAFTIKSVYILICFVRSFIIDSYYNFYKAMGLVGYIILIAIYSYFMYMIITHLMHTGEWQKGVSSIQNQFNTGVNNVQNSINKMSSRNQMPQEQTTGSQSNVQVNVQNENQKQQTVYANANYMNQGQNLVYQPISTLGYIGYTLLFCLPIIGFILIIVFALTAGNQNLKNYARSYLCYLIIIIIIVLIIFAATGGAILSSRYYW